MMKIINADFVISSATRLREKRIFFYGFWLLNGSFLKDSYKILEFYLERQQLAKAEASC